MALPTAAQFEEEIRREWTHAIAKDCGHLEVNAGELHRALGGYPGPNHRMPDCCQVMKRLMTSGDRIVSTPPSGQGSSLTIRYRVPR